MMPCYDCRGKMPEPEAVRCEATVDGVVRYFYICQACAVKRFDEQATEKARGEA